MISWMKITLMLMMIFSPNLRRAFYFTHTVIQQTKRLEIEPRELFAFMMLRTKLYTTAVCV